MATLNTSLWLPSNVTDIQRGGGPSMLAIEVLSDYSAVQTNAMWDLYALFTDKNYDFGSQGGGSKPLDIGLIDGEKYTMDDNSVANSLLTKAITYTTLKENMMSFLDTVKGKKYFIIDYVGRIGDSKRVFFSFGYFDLKLSTKRNFDNPASCDINFICKADGLASAPTLPALPANTDTKFATDDQSKKYLGWLLGSTDSTKGGFGTAVSLPSTSTELIRTAVGYVKTF